MKIAKLVSVKELFVRVLCYLTVYDIEFILRSYSDVVGYDSSEKTIFDGIVRILQDMKEYLFDDIQIMFPYLKPSIHPCEHKMFEVNDKFLDLTDVIYLLYNKCDTEKIKGIANAVRNYIKDKHLDYIICYRLIDQ